MEGSREYPIEVRQEGRTLSGNDQLAEEVAIALVYNGVSHAVMMGTPLDLDDFGLGFSLTEGIIDQPHQLTDIEIIQTDLGIELQMQIVNQCISRLQERRRQLSGRTGCGICGLESLQAIRPTAPIVDAGELPDFDVINCAIEEMHDGQKLNAICGAVHAAALADDQGHIQCLREDVGRHNALDKLLGATAREDKKGFVVVSSRASYEMVVKSASQNISTLVAVSAPTSLALDLARKSGMNLIGFVRPGRQVIYHQT